MDIQLMIYVMMYISLGALVGFLSGLLGVGGGGILVPLLVSIFTYQGMDNTHIMQMALGTSLACSLPTTATSAYSHNKKGAVLWHIVKLVSPSIVVGSIIGVMISTNIEGKYLALFFAIFMMIVAIKMFSNWQPPSRQTPNLGLSSVVGGLSIGLVSSLISVGGAFFSILLLTYNNIDLKKAIGTSSAIGFVAVILATLGYLFSTPESSGIQPYSLGYIYLPALCLVTLSSVLMVPIGTNISHRLPSKKLKQILGVVCVLLSLKLSYSFFLS
ncbi:sulfite exporter TauE/SafE family protein [Psychrobacter phenylpyruvicus]|uniref:Probable membrane transporter protein n=1 Tax=Psychrobacter phenylpyruvicus TaxID=29432 RepID=A0A379LK80_9GAMM|nr:sulfite exporter TauE/SafE family protein [Psychrobacter phenylpyruvicus]SUD90831.1 Sulfite exporter TauE/SafE [Psychrobacter phenylpyruvicus]